MQYHVALDPELQLSPTEFVTAWNGSPHGREAPASLAPASRDAFLSPEITVALITAAVSIPTTVIATVVAKYLEEKYIKKEPPKVTVTTITTPGGQPVLIIKQTRE